MSSVCTLIHYSLRRELISSPEDYWDSYWIVQGLIKSELYDVVKETLENFMDELQNFGFIPNGGRIYCVFLVETRSIPTLTPSTDLNRSQPPLFIHVSAAPVSYNVLRQAT